MQKIVAEILLEQVRGEIGDIVGRKWDELFTGVSLSGRGSPLSRMMRSGSHEEEDVHIEERDEWLFISADPVLDDGGEVTGGVCTVRDISARMRAELEKRGAKRQRETR